MLLQLRGHLNPPQLSQFDMLLDTVHCSISFPLPTQYYPAQFQKHPEDAEAAPHQDMRAFVVLAYVRVAAWVVLAREGNHLALPCRKYT